MRLLCALGLVLGLGACPSPDPGAGTAFTPQGGGGGPGQVEPPTPQANDPIVSDPTGPSDPGPVAPDPMDGPQLKADLQAPEAVHFGVRTGDGSDSASGGEAFTPQTLTLKNRGGAASGALSVSLEGDWLSLSETMVGSLDPGAEHELVLTPHITGTGERILSAKIRVHGQGIDFDVPVYAAVADPGLPAITFESDTWTDARAVAPLPRAPWPQTSSASAYKAHVHMSLPKGFRRSARRVEVMIALHGHGGVLAETLPAKKYVEQAYYSNRNAVLIVPQGLYDQSADDFGQLRQQDGVKRLVDEVLIALYRAGKIVHPIAGRVVVSSHSGGYNSLSDMLTKSGVPGGLSGVILMDSLYGWSDRYKAWIQTAAGKFVSNYQNADGNSPTQNSEALASQVEGLGIDLTAISRRPLPEAVQSAQNLFHRIPFSHGNVVLGFYALGEYWRGSLLEPKGAPRPILRRVALRGGKLEIDLFGEPTLSAEGYRIHTSADGVTFSPAADVAYSGQLLEHLSVDHAAAAAWVRVTSLHGWLGESAPSDTYFARAGTRDDEVIVVDAFDRMLDGAHRADTHDFAARIGSDVEATSSVTSCADEAVETGACVLSGAGAVVWLAGLSSVMNPPIDAPARSLLQSYLAAGGRLLLSGAEVAYALTHAELGAGSFVSGTLKVSGYSAGAHDDATSTSALGAGGLAALSTFSFGGADSYAVDYPDILPPGSGASTVLTYAGASQSAAVLVPNSVLTVGFPLETITPVSRRGEVLRALLQALR